VDLALSVDEPATLPLFAVGIILALAYASRRRRTSFGRDAEVAP
jgi:ABC-type sulfate transport system permease component